MDLNTCDWKFNKSVATEFNEHVRQSVPLYQEIHYLINEMAQWFLEDGTNVYDLGTSTAEVIKNLVTFRNKNVNYIGVDESKDMLDEIDNNLKENKNIEFINDDIKNVSITNASFITSVLTLQFISEKDRYDIVQNIYNGLNKGGAFVLVEKILANNTLINNIWEGLYYDMKLFNGLDEKHIINKQRSIRGVMKPLTLNENKKMLEDVGFTKYEEFFKWGNFVGYIAIK